MKTHPIRIGIISGAVLCIIALTVYILSFSFAENEKVVKQDGVKPVSVNFSSDYNENKNAVHNLLVIYKDGKFALADNSGNPVCEYKYDMISPASNGLYYIRNNKTNGFINEALEEVFMTEEVIGTNISEDFVVYTRNGKSGFINIKTGEKIEAVYEAVYDFSEGLAAVQLDGKIGFVNTKGHLVIPNDYHANALYHFNSGLCNAIVTKEDGSIDSFYIDVSGNKIVDGNFEYGMQFYSDVAFVKTSENKWHLINKNGDRLNDHEYGPYENGMPTKFNEGFATVLYDGKYGIIAENGKFVISPAYEWLSSVSEGVAVYKSGDKYGAIRSNGSVLINAVYDGLTNFTNGLSVFVKDGKNGVINKNGIIICNAEYVKCEILDNGNIKAYVDENKYIYKDKYGNTIWQAEN